MARRPSKKQLENVKRVLSDPQYSRENMGADGLYKFDNLPPSDEQGESKLLEWINGEIKLREEEEKKDGP